MAITMTQAEMEYKLKELCTNEFLYTLAEVGKLYGWNCGGDYHEIASFISDLHKIANLDEPYLCAYEVDDV